MLGNDPSPIMDLIKYVLARYKLRYLLFTDVTGFRSPRPAFFTGVLLRFTTMDEIYFDFPKKRRGKRIYGIIFSNEGNAYSIFFVTHFRNIHSYWIEHTTVE